VGYAGGELLVQGNQQVDIVALSHPESGLFGGGDVVLRSAKPVLGDAHYWSGGNFRVEQLDGRGGRLESPHDPIIFADGDIFLEEYTGASLHLWAGGNIVVPQITITGNGTVENTIAQTVTLSDGTPLMIDGAAQPTLDLRAGIDWAQLLPMLPGNLSLGVPVDPDAFGNSATTSDLVVADIDMTVPGGLIFLTNQFFPNSRLPGGNINVFGDINATGIGGDGTSIVIDAANDILVTPFSGDGVINTASDTGSAGDVTFLAQGSVGLIGTSRTDTANLLSNINFRAFGDTGKITINAEENLILFNAQISNTLFGTGSTDFIDIDVSGDVIVENAQIFSTIAAGGVGESSGININARSLSLLGESGILSIVRGPEEVLSLLIPAGQGNAGDITITVEEGVLLAGNDTVQTEPDGRIVSSTIIASALAPEASGSVGNIIINADSLFLDNAASIRSAIDEDAKGDPGMITLTLNRLQLDNFSQIISATEGEGNAGTLDITVQENTSLANRSALVSSVFFGAVGDAGIIDIESGSLNITGGSLIQSAVLGPSLDEPAGIGNAGDITVKVRDHLTISGEQDEVESRITTELGTGTEGIGGSIFIRADEVIINDRGSLNASTVGSGQAGSIKVIADTVQLDSNGGIQSSTDSAGDAGNIQLDVDRLSVNSGSFVLTDALFSASGRGGEIVVNADEAVEIRGVSASDFDDNGMPDASGLYAQTRGSNTAGSITLNTSQLMIADGGTISAGTSGRGEGGNVSIVADTITITGGSPDQSFSSNIVANAENDSSGNAGDISIIARELVAADGGFISSSSEADSMGNAGNVTLNIDDSIELIGRTLDGDNPTGISVAVQPGASGNAGNIEINTGRLSLREGGRILAQNLGSGQSGFVTIAAGDAVEIISSEAGNSLINSAAGPLARSRSDNPTSIDLKTRNLRLIEGGQIATITLGSADASDIIISASESIKIVGTSADGIFNSGLVAGSIPLTLEQPRQDENSEFIVREATGRGGNIFAETNQLDIFDGGEISSAAFSVGNAGNISLMLNRLNMQDGTISTESTQGSGGSIQVQADSAQLFRDSDITTSVAQGTGSGGNIMVTANSVVAFDDSDILAFAADGSGGNIDLSDTAFLGEDFSEISSSQMPQLLDGNGRVDVNATGQRASGTVTIPDVSFIENSLTELPTILVNTESLVTNSCIARGADNGGTLTFTGGDRLTQSPNEVISNPYTVGDVQTILPTSIHQPAAIVEPQAIYRLADGRLLMSRDCL
jgi:large exoprotein involved in heme utilization and adhesion